MTSSEELLEKARKLKNDGKFEEALEIIEILMSNNPESEEIKRFHVELLFAFGYHLNDQYIEGYENAAEIFSKIVEIEPGNYRAIYNKGIAYFYMEKMEEALKLFFKTIDLKPDYKFPYYNIGLVYETTGEIHKALDYYRKALEIDPDFLYALHAKAEVKEKIKFARMSRSKPVIDVNKLKDILEVSKKVRISTIQDILHLQPRDIEIIIDWCKKYHFKIDGDFLIINKEHLSELIDFLEVNND